jgi:hypothetical protein
MITIFILPGWCIRLAHELTKTTIALSKETIDKSHELNCKHENAKKLSIDIN